MGVADVRIVEAEMIPDAIVGELHERAESVGDLARIEKAHLLRKNQVPVLGERAVDRAVRERGLLVWV